MVKAWREAVVIPTYKPGAPEKNPIFLEKRVYQGSSGVVYPYPVIESIADEKEDVEYQAVFLENEYIKVMILPELGGRVQMAYDKIKQRHFIYYNQVIKPALVGLAGPWISGGIEFNWPQHHRPSTFMPVDSLIEENKDGSVTVWVNERERMFHQQGQAGFTLRPGCAYLEIKGRLYNPTEVPQTFLWWANPAVAVNDHYQSVFPPDVNAVFDHGKRAVSSFPIATGTYYKMDYSAGVDISNYKNIFVPTSYMVAKSKYNFEGGYENDTRGGMLHVADHHVAPGKKQWTWGNGDFGRAWDRNLTDEDGPYIELMAGVFTENQPDFTWLMPYEEKTFTQYFMPYRELGIVKNASKDLIMNITPPQPSPQGEGDGKLPALLQVLATSKKKYRIVVEARTETLFDEIKSLSPEEVFAEEIFLKGHAFSEIKVTIKAPSPSGEGWGGDALSWQPEPEEIRSIPDAAEPALRPEEIKTCEQLFLTGLHLEQYRHATFCALDYYEEALRRDPLDVRNNNAVGLWYLRRGRFQKAEPYFRTAVKVLQKRNPNPYDGEPIYNLGLCLKYQEKYDEAYDWFYKATWNAAWQDVGFFACAQISVRQGRLEDALEEIDKALVRNWHNHKARALKAAVLRLLGRKEECMKVIDESLAINKFNYGCLFEKYKATNDSNVLDELATLMRDESHNYDEVALDYFQAGLNSEAVELWDIAVERGATSPMTYYYRELAITDTNTPCKYYTEKDVICFPNRLEAIAALEHAIYWDTEDAYAPYYLGNLYYDKRQYDLAIEYWQMATERDPQLPTPWRNLALAAFNKQDDKEKAVEYMERAFSLDTTDARVFMELDQLYKRLGRPHQQRLDNLDKYYNLVAQRDDLLLEHITLLNLTGRYEEAMKELDAHQFHPWEGGEGKVPAQYQLSRVELAKQALKKCPVLDDSIVELLEQCLVYPHNLGEGKLHGALDNDFLYLLGLAHQQQGDDEKAKDCWQRGTIAPMEPAAALYYNDAAPDKLFYAAMCERALGNEDKARSRFNRLIAYGEQHLNEEQKPDYFAVSLPDLLVWDGDLTETNRIHCLYMLALGHYGMGNKEKAARFLEEAEKLNPNHLGIYAFKSFAK